ncbi:hypothetical protein GcM1_c13571o4 [Golovinomyces cichoracearum]|uniref:Uncharacterized protein n=1 Tax=Golovinomyces cichoracearum TaxID=62708 RepID=A0A420IL29_9PEZI|nr:hypothetical protein GcM1_c13571o4 [Golovinomyces cichoracearum]
MASLIGSTLALAISRLVSLTQNECMHFSRWCIAFTFIMPTRLQKTSQ